MWLVCGTPRLRQKEVFRLSSQTFRRGMGCGSSHEASHDARTAFAAIVNRVVDEPEARELVIAQGEILAHGEGKHGTPADAATRQRYAVDSGRPRWRDGDGADPSEVSAGRWLTQRTRCVITTTFVERNGCVTDGAYAHRMCL